MIGTHNLRNDAEENKIGALAKRLVERTVSLQQRDEGTQPTAQIQKLEKQEQGDVEAALHQAGSAQTVAFQDLGFEESRPDWKVEDFNDGGTVSFENRARENVRIDSIGFDSQIQNLENQEQGDVYDASTPRALGFESDHDELMPQYNC
jgi:hypothetical protein